METKTTVGYPITLTLEIKGAGELPGSPGSGKKARVESWIEDTDLCDKDYWDIAFVMMTESLKELMFPKKVKVYWKEETH